MSVYHNLQKATQVIESFSGVEKCTDINDVIELYHTRKFIDKGISLDSWSEEFISKSDGFNKIVVNYFNAIDSDVIVEIYDSVEFDYKESFWNIIEGFGIKGVLTEENIAELCESDKFTLHYILRCAKIVKRYNQSLAKLFKNNENAAEWLLDHYVAQHELGSKDPIIIPSALSLEDKEEIVNRYLDKGADANLNYVQLVINAKDDKNNFALSSKTRWKAQQLEQELVRQIFKPGVGIPMRTTVKMSYEENIAPVSCYSDEEGFLAYQYDAKLIDNLSNSDLMYYFQYAFEYLTKMGFINLISMSSQESAMERLMGLSAKNTYRENIDFKMKDQRAILQMTAMMNVLKHSGRRVEDVIKFFYEEHLKNEYCYPSQRITIPSEDSSYVEKFRSLAPELDAVTKQYNLYSKEGEIVLGLLALEPSIKVTDSNSCIDKKYFVINEENKDLQLMFHLIMGDQSMLCYVDPYKEEHHHSFFSLLKTMKPIDCSKYTPWQLNSLQPLIDKGFVKIGDDSVLQVLDWPKILVLQHLYKYKACPFWYYPEDMKKSVLEMEESGWVTCYNKLLTPEEQNYFSFILNDERYTNAYSIRNHYAHGSNAPADNEDLHKLAYTRLLIIFVLLLLKIDDDLSIKCALEKNRC